MSEPPRIDDVDVTAVVDRFLAARWAEPRGFTADAGALVVASDLSGTAQLHRLTLGRATPVPLPDAALTQVTDHTEPIDGRTVPVRERMVVSTDLGGDERLQLYLADADPPAPLRIDDLHLVAVDPAFVHRPGDVSPDGRRLAYATNRHDGVAFDVVVRDLDRGGEHLVWDGGTAFPGTWSPDGRWLAITVRTARPGDNRLLLIDVAGGAVRASSPDRADHAVEVLPHVDGPPASVGMPTWLPDGSACFVASSVYSEAKAIHRIEVAGATVHDPGGPVLDRRWDADCLMDPTGRHLLVTSNVDGATTAELRDPATLDLVDEVPMPGDGVASAFDIAPDGRSLTFGFRSARVPGDIWRYDLLRRRLDRLTVGPAPTDLDALAPPERAHAVAADGVQIPLFVHRPRTRRPPVVVAVHGGPESQWRPAFHPLMQALVASGVAVVAPNVRGSTGYGRTYEHLDDVERRQDAVDDLAAVHDWIAADGSLDAERVGLFGRSYGGYMALAGLVHHPYRWAAGVSVVGIASLITFLGRTSPYRRAWREAEYGSLARDRDVLERLSPLNHLDRLRAPLLLIHGRNDPRVPVHEAEQIHTIARARGLHSRLQVYDGEGHHLRRPANRRDAARTVVAFLIDVLGG